MHFKEGVIETNGTDKMRSRRSTGCVKMENTGDPESKFGGVEVGVGGESLTGPSCRGNGRKGIGEWQCRHYMLSRNSQVFGRHFEYPWGLEWRLS